MIDKPSSIARLTRRSVLAATTVATTLAVVSPPSSGIPASAQEVSLPIASPAAGQAAGAPALYVAPQSMLVDEPFTIELFYLDPGDEVTIRSAFTDYLGNTWGAEATYGANEYGYIACSAMTPVRGDFDVADSMAFIWAATPRVDAYYAPSLYQPETITISASIGDREIGTATVERSVLSAASYPPQQISTSEMDAIYFPPVAPMATPAPTVVLLGGSEGGISAYLSLEAGLLAARGYAVLAVGYFGIGTRPEQLNEVPLEFFESVLSWLDAEPMTNGDAFAVIGHSRGGELALLLGARYSQIRAIVSAAGSGYVIGALGDLAASAWTWEGKPLPFLNTYPELLTAAERERVVIPVERINGPVLFLAGDADEIWPATKWLGVAEDRLTRLQYPWPHQLLSYPGAGHALSTPHQPMTFARKMKHPRTGQAIDYGGDPERDQIASVNSWQAVLNHLAWWQWSASTDD